MSCGASYLRHVELHTECEAIKLLIIITCGVSYLRHVKQINYGIRYLRNVEEVRRVFDLFHHTHQTHRLSSFNIFFKEIN